ncbi:MAG: ABC transporter permease [Chloroflexota bacterium]
MFSNNTWSVFRYELVRNFKRKGFLFTTFGIPALGVAVFLVIQLIVSGGGDGTAAVEDLQFEFESISRAGYVDRSGLFDEPGSLAQDVLIPYQSEDKARRALEDEKIDVYYVIPADFAENGDITLYAPSFSFGYFTEAPISQLFFSRLLEQGVSRELVARLSSPANISTFEIAPAAAEDGELETDPSSVVNLFAILLVLSLFSTNGYLMQSVIEEKESRLIEILISAVRPIQLLAGKIFALGVLGLFQVSVYVVTILVVSSVTTDTGSFFDNLEISPGLLLIALVYFILGYLLFAAAFGAIGAISTSITEGPNIATIFIIPAMLPWILSLQFIEDPNGPVPTILSYFPLTSPMAVVMRAAATDVPILDYVISIGVLLLSIAGMLWIAGRLFRVQTLLAGKMPRIRELPKLIFGG